MSKHRESQTFEADGSRPIESANIEIVDTFEEDGIRPIAKGSEIVGRNQEPENDDCNDSKTASITNRHTSVRSDEVKEENQLKIDGERPMRNHDIKVVDTFEEDGTRPIIANQYEVVDTLDIDGERPITTQQ